MRAGGCLVVVVQWSEHWQLKPGALGSIPGNCRFFNFFSFASKQTTCLHTHTQSNISYTSIATKNVVDSSVQLNGYVRCTTYSKLFVFVFLLLLLLLSANCTCQFFLGIIRWTRHSFAMGFNMVEQCTINAWSTSWNRVWVLVNTLKHGTIVRVT